MCKTAPFDLGKTGSPVDTEKYMKPKVLPMSLANNSSLGDVVFVCCNFFKNLLPTNA